MASCRLAGITAALCLVASVAGGQTTAPRIPPVETPLAGEFDQLSRVLKAGEQVIVVDTGGRSIQGQVRSMSATSLVVAKRGSTIQFSKDDVASIRHKPDSPVNGTLIGLGLGFGLGLLVGVSIDDASTPTSDALCLIGIPAVAAAGGYFLDRQHSDRRLFFQKPRIGLSANVGLVQPPNRIAKPRASVSIVLPIGRK